MRKQIRCGSLFSGLSDQAEKDQTIVITDNLIDYVGPSANAPKAGPGEAIIDHSRHFVMPGLIDVHVHLAYGNAKTEEDIDLFSPVEFRALRGLQAAQCVLRAGYTSICDPATSGLVSPSIRDAFEAGLFVGPRVSASGPQITNRQGLTDWYPTWIGVPSTAIGVLCKNAAEGVAEIRKEVKDGVDFIKIAMDGDAMNPATTTVMAGYDQDEITAMTREVHRLGKKVVVHARGDEATLYSARAGVDVILHASFMTERTLEEVIKSGSVLCPSYLLVVNDIDFTRPGDGAYPGFPDAHRRELEAGARIHSMAHKAGVKYLVGTDSGFAITPYGEWHAKELEIYVKYFGFTPAEAIRAATVNNASFSRHAGKVGVLEKGRLADILVVDGDPLADVKILQDKARIRDIFLDGEAIDRTPNTKARRLRSEFSYQMWNEIYTQERIRELRASGTRQAAE
jgi:imidazolonepropionase-like amidohydrolase